MSVTILNKCINCGACIDKCPVNAIVSNEDNPSGENIYYVYEDKCIECVSFHEEPNCALQCPTEGCIVWSERINIENKNRGVSLEQVLRFD